jgi:hypothetical protein
LSIKTGLTQTACEIGWGIHAAFETFHDLAFLLPTTVPFAPTAVRSPAHNEASITIGDRLPMFIKLRQFLQMTAKSPAFPVFSKATSAFRALFVRKFVNFPI